MLDISHILGPVTLLPGTNYADVSLYFDNITMTGLDQVFYVDLEQINGGSGININTTQSRITLEAIGNTRGPCTSHSGVPSLLGAKINHHV